MDKQTFENAFIVVVCEILDRHGIDHSDFAERAYKEEGSESTAVRKWRKQRNTGQKISLWDAKLLADALMMDLPYLLHISLLKAKEISDCHQPDRNLSA